jgi:hypothetical protein
VWSALVEELAPVVEDPAATGAPAPAPVVEDLAVEAVERVRHMGLAFARSYLMQLEPDERARVIDEAAALIVKLYAEFSPDGAA